MFILNYFTTITFTLLEEILAILRLSFIKNSQLNARTSFEALEWIPYSRLRNIKYLAQGGFSTIYEAIWLDEWIEKWDYEKHGTDQLCRMIMTMKLILTANIINPLKNDEECGSALLVLKSLNKSSNISEEFLNEWRLHLQCQCEALSNGSGLVPLFGITQDPNTKNHMVVMGKMPLDNLRNNLMVKKYNPSDKFNNLLLISAQLEAIHKLDLVHGDRYLQG
ncbi:unnamed protein product [Rhizophagus irregularis]|nr:unnamed protein product [Rhizophagus irregularis]